MEKIKVIGKQRFEGKSKKTGNDYNFISVYFISDLGSRGIGQRGDSINLDPTFYNYEDILVGREYEVSYGRYGRVDGFILSK